MRKKLTHKDLVKIGQALGYKLDSGICQGFSLMLCQAWLADDEANFFERLHLLEQYKNPETGVIDLETLKTDIAKARLVARTKPYELLNKKIRQLIEIPAFFEGIEMYLVPQRHSEIFGIKSVNQDDISSIYPLACPEVLEGKNLSILFNSPGAFDENSLTLYLKDLEKVFLKTNTAAPVILSSINHTVCLLYDTKLQNWVFVDTNDFQRSASTSYCRVWNSQQLAKNIFNSFFCSNSANSVFYTTVVGKSDPTSTLASALEIFEQNHPIRLEQLTKYDVTGINIMHLAAREGNLKVVLELLKQDEVYSQGYLGRLITVFGAQPFQINYADPYGSTALHYACFNDKAEIIRTLVQHPNINVNQADHSGKTALHLACSSNKMDTLTVLLTCRNLRINQKDKKGFTALHYACKNADVEALTKLLNYEEIGVNTLSFKKNSPLHTACYSKFTRGKKVLFEKLLQQGANLDLKNKKGYSALDIAIAKGHDSAIKAITNYARVQRIDINSIASPRSLRLLEKRGIVKQIRSSSSQLDHQKAKEKQAKVEYNSCRLFSKSATKNICPRETLLFVTPKAA